MLKMDFLTLKIIAILINMKDIFKEIKTNIPLKLTETMEKLKVLLFGLFLDIILNKMWPMQKKIIILPPTTAPKVEQG